MSKYRVVVCTASDVLEPWYEIERQLYPDCLWDSLGRKYPNKQLAITACAKLNEPPPIYTRKVIYP